MKTISSQADVEDIRVNPTSAVGVADRSLHYQTLGLDLGKLSEIVPFVMVTGIVKLSQELINETSNGIRGKFTKQALIKRGCPKKDIYRRSAFTESGGRMIVTASVTANNIVQTMFHEYLQASATFPLLPFVDEFGWALAATSVAATFVTLKPTQSVRLFTLGQSLLGGKCR